MDSSVKLWNTGTSESPVIQGQAGKPFAHEKGPIVQFPQYNEDHINNACLCSYKYYRYYAIYACLKPKSGLTFYKSGEGGSSYGYIDSNNKFPDYTIQTKSGYQWELLTGYQYLGCYPKGTFTCGVWEKLPLPYSDMAQQKLPSPSPSWLTDETPWDCATVLRMVVNSYKCCNGYHGCGLRYPQQDDEWLQMTGYFCQGIYTVSNLDTEDPRAVLEEGSSHCSLGHQRQFEEPVNCSTMRVRVYHPFFPLPEDEPLEYCPDCFNTLQETAIAHAQEALRQCVIWKLWAIDQCVCNPPPQDGQEWTLIESRSVLSVPDKIWGKGDGALPQDAHTEETESLCHLCGESHKDWDIPASHYTIYKWKKYPLGTQQFTPPANLTEHICTDCIDPNDPFKNSEDDQSIPGSEIEPPCNTPDPPPQLYRELTYELFDVYKTTLAKSSTGGQGDPYSQNECRDVWTFSKDQNDHIEWSLQETDQKDYQIYMSWPPKVQDNEQDQDEKILYFVVKKGDTPPETATELAQVMGDDFFDGQEGPSMYGQNRCSHYWDICLKCPGEGEEISLPCPPSYLGQLAPSYLQDHNLCVDAWREPPPESTCLFSYVTTSQKAQWCLQEVNKVKAIEKPSLHVIFKYKTYTPGCSDGYQRVVDVSDWKELDKKLTFEEAVQKGLCTSSPYLIDGFYIPCKVPQDCTQSQGAALCQSPLSQLFIQRVQEIQPDQSSVIRPGRMSLDEECTDIGQKDPVCIVYYIHYVGSYWDPVYARPGSGEISCITTLKDKFDVQAQQDNPQAPQVTVQFQQDCLPSIYGIRVKFLGWSVFQGIQFSQETVQGQIKWYMPATGWTWDTTFDTKKEFDAHYPSYGDLTNFVSGFYQINGGIKLQAPFDKVQLSTASISISGGCAVWDPSEAPAGNPCSLPALVYVQAGFIDKCATKIELPMRAIHGMNGSAAAYIGFKIPMKIFGNGRNNDPAWRYDCAAPSDLTTQTSPYYHRTLFQRMYDNGDIHWLVLPQVSCIWDTSQAVINEDASAQMGSGGLMFSYIKAKDTGPFGHVALESYVISHQQGLYGGRTCGDRFNNDVTYTYLCRGPRGVAYEDPVQVWKVTGSCMGDYRTVNNCRIYNDAPILQTKEQNGKRYARINARFIFTDTWIQDNMYGSSYANVWDTQSAIDAHWGGYRFSQALIPSYLYTGQYCAWDKVRAKWSNWGSYTESATNTWKWSTGDSSNYNDYYHNPKSFAWGSAGYGQGVLTRTSGTGYQISGTVTYGCYTSWEADGYDVAKYQCDLQNPPTQDCSTTDFSLTASGIYNLNVGMRRGSEKIVQGIVPVGDHGTYSCPVDTSYRAVAYAFYAPIMWDSLYSGGFPVNSILSHCDNCDPIWNTISCRTAGCQPNDSNAYCVDIPDFNQNGQCILQINIHRQWSRSYHPGEWEQDCYWDEQKQDNVCEQYYVQFQNWTTCSACQVTFQARHILKAPTTWFYEGQW